MALLFDHFLFDTLFLTVRKSTVGYGLDQRMDGIALAAIAKDVESGVVFCDLTLSEMGSEREGMSMLYYIQCILMSRRPF